MLRLTLALLVVQSSALALQPVHARSAAAVRSAVAMMATKRDFEDDPAYEASMAGVDPEVLARLRSPIRQYDGGWGDTPLRGGGKSGEIPKGKYYGTGDGTRLDDDATVWSGDSGGEGALPPEKQAMLVLPEESWKVEKMDMSQTDEDFVIECKLDEGEMEAEMFIDIEPMFLTEEEYFYGFTADSDAKISIDPSMSSDVEGVMSPKEHQANVMGGMEKRVMIKLKFNPAYQVGEFDAYLCFIFPNEKNFSSVGALRTRAPCTTAAVI